MTKDIKNCHVQKLKLSTELFYNHTKFERVPSQQLLNKVNVKFGGQPQNALLPPLNPCLSSTGKGNTCLCPTPSIITLCFATAKKKKKVQK